MEAAVAEKGRRVSISKHLSRSERTKLKTCILQTIDATFQKCQGMEGLGTDESDAYWEMAEELMRLWAQMKGVQIRRKLEIGLGWKPVETPQKPAGITREQAIAIGDGVQRFARAMGGKPIGEE